MQGKVKIFKLTSKQFPDKVWDTPNHFVFTTESRQVAKDDKKFQSEVVMILFSRGQATL